MFEALQFDFMRNALAAGLLASIICGILGTLIVVNRQTRILSMNDRQTSLFARTREFLRHGRSRGSLYR